MENKKDWKGDLGRLKWGPRETKWGPQETKWVTKGD